MKNHFSFKIYEINGGENLRNWTFDNQEVI